MPTPVATAQPKPPAYRSGFMLAMKRRPRLFIGIAIAVAAFLVTPSDFREATRALIGWNVGAWSFLILIFRMMWTGPRESIRAHASQEDENPWVLLAITIGAGVAAMAAIVWELGPVKDMTGLLKASHLGLVAATILSAWAFIHVMFALHYAGEYYADTPNPEDGDKVRGGLKFPGDDEPDWGDFLYQAFVIGCACATADVNTTSSEMRAVCLTQGVVAFFFNTIILALTINIGAGLI